MEILLSLFFFGLGYLVGHHKSKKIRCSTLAGTCALRCEEEAGHAGPHRVLDSAGRDAWFNDGEDLEWALPRSSHEKI